MRGRASSNCESGVIWRVANRLSVQLQNRGAALPLTSRWHAARALVWISPIDLDGVAFVALHDKLSPATHFSEKWHQRATAQKLSVPGVYYVGSHDDPTHIVLYMQDIYRAIPKIFAITSVPTLLIAHTLAHEVAHHLIRGRGYVFEPTEMVSNFEIEEEMANRYAFSVIRRMTSHWYYRLGSWMIRKLASLQYVRGQADWRQKKYAAAAERWYETWLLDPNRQDAVLWYSKAKQLIGDNQK